MILISMILFVVLIYLFLRYVYSYWSRKGIPFIAPEIPFGNIKSVIFKQRQFGLAIYDLHAKTTERFIGIYLLYRPAILIRDPELAKAILIEDFTSFHDRGTYYDEKVDPLSTNLFCLPGEKWKVLRNKLTPAFTSGKLKGMTPTILEVGKNLGSYLKKSADREEIVDVKEEFIRYTMDTVASVIFGLETSQIGGPNNLFTEAIEAVNHPSFIEGFQTSLSFLCPGLLIALGRPMFNHRSRKFMMQLTRDAIEHRENSRVARKDLMQLLVQLRNSETLEENNDEFIIQSKKDKLLTVEEISAQTLVFYLAGSETTSSAMSFCLHELTQNPSLLKKVQTEIDSVLAKHKGELTYDAIHDMTYLEQCLMETLRKYPGLTMLNRQCTKDYKVPGSNITIEKGTPIVLSVFGIHRDPEIYPNPEKFDPERYSPENKAHNERYYFAFGGGPKTCIAYRMGKLMAKVGLATVLSQCNFEAMEKKEIEFDVRAITLISDSGIKLRISNRN